MIFLLIESLFAFLLGSIPFGMLVCNALGLQAPNTYGSKNIGASNVARQNLLAGFLTLALDAGKGYLALKACSPHYLVLLAVVSGHCFSPLLNFNGGKGVATYGGGLLALNPLLGFTLALIWFPTVLYYPPATASLAICAFSIAYASIGKNYLLIITALIIIYRHRDNVQKRQKK